MSTIGLEINAIEAF